MKITLKQKIWLTVTSIVVIFTLILLVIIPSQQEKYFIQNYNHEIQNLANTVSLGVEIALEEQNFDGVQKAMNFAKGDDRLTFIALLKVDTVSDPDADTMVAKRREVFSGSIYPKGKEIDPNMTSNDSVIIKRSPFQTSVMSGEVMAGFSTREIEQNLQQMQMTALAVSVIVFIIGIVIGLWLARNISIPVLAIRDAAFKVGAGDRSQQVPAKTKDEIGELGEAFNKMVVDLAEAERSLTDKNKELEKTLANLEEQKKIVEDEKQRSDNLLRNILPAETAEELKAKGKSEPRYFDRVTVMFADFKQFTNIAEQLSSKELVYEIDECFRGFDNIIGKYPIEKIKTIGDSYLCVGGLPTENNTHPFDIVNAALEMQMYLQRIKEDKMAKNMPYFEARLGVHTGPVVAGIVGVTKFAYDIWGDTVNTASRMEASGEIGRVNISATTYELVKNHFSCQYRGQVEAKNKGEIDMYFVEEQAENVPQE
jgi:class 3 adenylate cyclase/HAMP domain-containing protein